MPLISCSYSKTALMACADHWTSAARVGSHHIATALLNKGWRVAFVSDPISPWHILGKTHYALKERWELFCRGGQWYGELFAWSPFALLPPHNYPLLRSSWVHRHWQQLAWPRWETILHRAGFGKVDLLYLDSYLQSFLLQRIPHQASVFRITDPATMFNKTTPVALQLESQLAQRVDLSIYVNSSMKDYVQQLQPKNSCCIPNGVNYQHFAQNSLAPPPEYQRLQKPIAVFAGRLMEFVDFQLIEYIARELPQLQLVIIAPPQQAGTMLPRLPNLHLLGPKPHAQLPAFFQHAQIGLIPFCIPKSQQLDWTRYIAPLKLWEYLAAGLPVVSTPLQIAQSAPVQVAHTPQEFVRVIQHTLQHPPPKQLLQKAAKSMDWQHSLKPLLQALASRNMSQSLHRLSS